jgi:ribosomal protein S18 acetylase RimI-like enzyme
MSTPKQLRPRSETVSIRRLTPDDAAAYRALMLEAYARHPGAFTSTAAEREALPLSWWTSRLDVSPQAPQVVLGAFDDMGLLAGAAGLLFESGEKSRHKAKLFGMYVVPAARQSGFGRQLVVGLLAEAAAREGVKLVQLTVTQGNDAAQALYERCGFAAFGIEPFAVAQGGTFLSKVHMWRAVAALALSSSDASMRWPPAGPPGAGSPSRPASRPATGPCDTP